MTQSTRLHHIVWLCVLLLYSHFSPRYDPKSKKPSKWRHTHIRIHINIYIYLEREGEKENSRILWYTIKKESRFDVDDVF